MKATLSLDWYELNDLKWLIIQRIKRLAAEYRDTRRSYLQDNIRNWGATLYEIHRAMYRLNARRLETYTGKGITLK
jgi:hypothetical protein